MPDIYIPCTYDEYKQLEDQLSRYKELETEHPSKGYYHKAFRIKIGETTIEFNGPIAKGPQEICSD